MIAHGTVNMPAILVANGLGAGLMLLVLLSCCGKKKNQSLDGRLFNEMALMTICLCLIEIYTFWVDGKQFLGARLSSIVSNAMLFAINIFFAFLWTCYADYKLTEDARRFRTVYPWIGIPAGITIVLCGLNLVVPVFFEVNASNIYSRTPLTVLVYLLTYIYLIYGAVRVTHYRQRVNKYLFMPVVQFMLPIFIGSMVQLLHYGIALIWASVALGMTSLYLNLQQEEIYIDALTRLYNRNYLIRYMERMSEQARQGMHIQGILMDINSFKKINDTYGHVEGDRVLQGVGRILLQSVKKGTVVARYGGDEFMILLKSQSERDIENIKIQIQKNLDCYNAEKLHPVAISLSAGTAEFDLKNIDDFIQKMDQNMYKEKQRYYQEEGKQDRECEKTNRADIGGQSFGF